MSGQVNPTKAECEDLEEIDKQVAYIMEEANSHGEDYTEEDRLYILAIGGYTVEDYKRYLEKEIE